MEISGWLYLILSLVFVIFVTVVTFLSRYKRWPGGRRPFP